MGHFFVHKWDQNSTSLYVVLLQLQNIAEFLQTFIMMIENGENKLQTSLPYKECQHKLPQETCCDSKNLAFLCPSSEEVKYEMTRVSVDFVSIFLVESGAALNVQVGNMQVVIPEALVCCHGFVVFFKN